MMRSLVVLLVFGCAVFAGCGSSARGGPRVSSPFTQAHAALFDDGVDLLEDPGALEGRWQEDWSRELDQRLEQADAVFVASVQTLRVDVNLDKSESYRVGVEVERTIKGDDVAPEQSLVSREHAAGYGSIERNKDTLLKRRFVVFVKYADQEGQVVGHFHLTPPSRTVLERVEAFEEGRKPNTIHTVTHTN